MMKVKDALKKGYAETEISIKVLMHPETGNILYPCDKLHGKDKVAFDRYSIISDPVTEDAEEEGKAVNLLCKDHKKRWMKRFVPPSLGGLIGMKAKILIGEKWEKVSKRMAERLYKKHGWFGWLFPEDE